ncbi:MULTISPECIES: phospholipase D-like domain-containing protein [Serratia]|nr:MULTISPECIES: phospholipase D-like domain-containing protein [Serratia]ULG13635.1 serine recombinase [Serratia proteamaculans]ULG14033.1 serine recombinase [Serratia proteamaculans]ULG14540.1 serine recombinase [Serratia proteamaculans]ULG15086.1 serine recombinase [Serratia proteamaculans]ULG16084.1 serine recombinase [Serratia proteamaculans]
MQRSMIRPLTLTGLLAALLVSLPAKASPTFNVGFSPSHSAKAAVMDVINHAQQTLNVEAYSFTDKDLARALLVAKKRGVMLDMLEAIARKDYQDRRRRQEEGIVKAKAAGKLKGRQPDQQLHAKIIELRVKNNQSIRDTARLCGVSERTVIRIVKQANNDN